MTSAFLDVRGVLAVECVRRSQAANRLTATTRGALHCRQQIGDNRRLATRDSELALLASALSYLARRPWTFLASLSGSKSLHRSHA
jgi:hypothetical protein